MQADWEVEVGGGAPVIEADWAGFVDIRRDPRRVGEIVEAAAFPPLARMLLRLNGARSAIWTSKCDLWEPQPGTLGCYLDLLPRRRGVFASLHAAEMFCRKLVASLDAWVRPADMQAWNEESKGEASCSHQYDASQEAEVTLVIRQAVAAGAEGLGVTAYLSVKQASRSEAQKALAAGMNVFVDALLNTTLPQERIQSKK